MHWRSLAETLTITLAAIVASLILFGAFMMVYTGLFSEKGMVSLTDLYYQMYMGSFGTKFSWQSTLTRAAPLLLTALCTAIPARLGLIVIGGEGALALGALASVSTGLLLKDQAPMTVQFSMAAAGILAGGLLIAFVGSLRHWRGVNETIASLLATYIAIAVFNFLVEGPMKDPASLNKPSTYKIEPEYAVGTMFGTDVHWGLAIGLVACVLAWMLMDHTTFGFACRMVGGNVRSAQAAGLPVGRLILAACFLAGGAAGLAGMVEIGAVHGQANASVLAGYGFTGILVAFVARHHPLAIIPAAILLGGLDASSGMLQRRLQLNDATKEVFKGTIFVMILLFETFYGRFRIFQRQFADTKETAELPHLVAPSPAKEAVAS